MTANPPRLLSLDGCYAIPDAADSKMLNNDAEAWLSAAEATVNAVALQLGDDGSDLASNPGEAARMLQGAGYLIEMARSAVEAAPGRT